MGYFSLPSFFVRLFARSLGRQRKEKKSFCIAFWGPLHERAGKGSISWAFSRGDIFAEGRLRQLLLLQSPLLFFPPIRDILCSWRGLLYSLVFVQIELARVLAIQGALTLELVFRPPALEQAQVADDLLERHLQRRDVHALLHQQGLGRL